jgi:hypothetical protein
MECLKTDKIQHYIEKILGSVETSRIRDHLILCEKCQLKYKQYLQIENGLDDPLITEPPVQIERHVMKKIYAKLPTYSSIFTLIAASIVMLVSWIYIYFDFSNNSLIQALKLTSNSTSSWLGQVIKVISDVFSSVYAIYKSINKFFEIILDVNIGIEIFGLSVLIITMILVYGLYLLVFKRSKKQKI